MDNKKSMKIVLCVRLSHRKENETYRCHTDHSRKAIMTSVGITHRESVRPGCFHYENFSMVVRFVFESSLRRSRRSKEL